MTDFDKFIEELIKKQEENRACESELCELLEVDNLYFTVYPNTDTFLDSNYLGCTIVKCKEGYLSLPIDTYDFHNGFEQKNATQSPSIVLPKVKFRRG